MKRFFIGALMALGLSAATPISASEEHTPILASVVTRGPVTNLPMPRFVSLKASEGNVRRGPSLSHRIDWVFRHRGMPLQVIAEYGHWRRVIDREGAGGWVHYTLISGARNVLVTEPEVALRKFADPQASIAAFAETGVIARLGKCQNEWCKVTTGSAKGWVQRHEVWGILPNEVRE
ncbi:MAG: SH3 domain-containing protein [Litoreibacter sp.]